MHFELAYFYIFVLIHLELKRQIRLYACVVPSKIKKKKGKNTKLCCGIYLYGLYRSSKCGAKTVMPHLHIN